MSDYQIVELGALEHWIDPENGKHFVDKDMPMQYIGTSANALAPGGSAPFWHTHSQLEELYVFLTGEGQFALDDEVIDVRPGSAVRVGQGVWRAWRCPPDSKEPLRWLCVRAGGGVLTEIPRDGEIDRDRPMPWA